MNTTAANTMLQAFTSTIGVRRLIGMVRGNSGESLGENERETKVIGRVERNHWGRDLKCFIYEEATKEECDAYSGIVRVADALMRQPVSQEEEEEKKKEGAGAEEGQTRKRKLRFTDTITVSEYILNACPSANLCTHPLPRPLSLRASSILRMPRYGGGGFVASDRDIQHVRDMGTLMLAMQDYNAEGKEDLAKDVYTEALCGASILWRREYIDNQPLLSMVTDEVAGVLFEDVEMVDAEGCFDMEDGVLEDPFDPSLMDAVKKELEEEGLLLGLEDDGVVDVVEADLDSDLEVAVDVVVEPVFVANVSDSDLDDVVAVVDDLGSSWVVPDVGGVRVRRSRRVLAASETLGSCWIQHHGRSLRRSRRLC